MTSGFGHIRAGDAMLDYAKENLSNVHAEHINFSNISSPVFTSINQLLYEIASKRFPRLWGWLYEISNRKGLLFFTMEKLLKLQALLNPKILKLFVEKKPDIIIFTNVLPAGLLADKIHRALGSGVTMTIVVTDYHGHVSYYIPHIDYYFVANTQVGEDLANVGARKEQIIVSGIPINPRFYVEEKVDELKLKYGIKNGFPVVVCIVSFKISEKELIRLLDQLLQQKINLIFIANGNETLYTAVRSAFANNDKLFAVCWTNVIEEYIKISNVVISKAGGLTVSECISLRKPLIMVNPIPGQEEYNAEFVEKNNFGVKAKNVNQIPAILSQVMMSSHTNQATLLSAQNPCEKIFSVVLHN